MGNLCWSFTTTKAAFVEANSLMTTSDRGWGWQIGLASWLAMGLAIAISGDCALAQIAPDTTLGASGSVVKPNAGGVDVISGGATRGGNLFHSFEQFSVLTGREAFFNNAADVQNIISRVTGESISNIDGLIRANGAANLFLLNPNGIIFGPSSSLDIGGSFVGSTASSINFADGTQFSATAPQTTPLLTVSVPIGLQLGRTAGSIRNQSKVTNSRGKPIGLQVRPGKTLAFVGGDVVLEGGRLTARGGRIELGSVAGEGLVSLTPIQKGYALGYQNVQNFQNIQLSQRALVDASGEGGGDIQVQAAQLELTQRSFIFADTLGAEAGGQALIQTTEAITLSDGSLITADVLGSGTGGDLTINTLALTVQGGAKIAARSFREGGRGGNLAVAASDSVNLIGNSLRRQLSSLSTETQGAQAAGDLTIETGKLTVQDRAQVATNTNGAGDAGDLTIRASDSVKVTGEGRILAQTERGSTGAGGNLTIETKRLEGTQLAVFSLGQGPAGKLTVITPEPLPNVETQIVPDETLLINSTVRSNFNTSIIEGGTQVGSNLFHSFAQFSLPTLSTAYFNNAPDIQNIISRVTGSSASNIDGKLQANGTANLFLLNPNGIIFGPSSSLDVGGSFVATTANAVRLGETGLFSASDASSNLLTLTPSALVFNAVAGKEIVNQSQAESLRGESLRGEINSSNVPVVGLQVPTGKTLALVGGNLVLEGGNLTAAEGRIELGSVAGMGEVSLSQSGNSWVLGYDLVDAFGNIQMEGGAYVDATGEKGGNFQLQGAQLQMTQGYIFADTYGKEAGGELLVHTTEGITLSNGSFISTAVLGPGTGGNLTVTTEKLILRDGSQLLTYVAGKGQGGTLTVNASESVELIGEELIENPRGRQSSGFVATALFDGTAGDITIETENLIVQNGAKVFASTIGQGNAGNIQINATNSVNLSGVDFSGYSSSLSTTTSGVGQGGNITVNTSAFQIAEGAVVNAQTTDEGNGGNITVKANTFEAINGGQLLTNTRSSGRAGSISLNATGKITISGSDPTFLDRLNQFGKDVVTNEGAASGLFANTSEESTGQGGDLTLKTGQLAVRDGAEVNVSSTGKGNAGGLRVEADSIFLNNQGKLQASTASGEGGNIELQAGDLILMRQNSLISAEAGSTGNGGNIMLNAPFIVAIPSENSDISANAFRGKGGRVDITASGIFGTQFREQSTPESDITASSTGGGINGVVTINTPDIDPSRGLVNLPAALVDASNQIAQSCPSGVRQGESKFIVTGRGGLPPNPSDLLNSDAVWVDLDSTTQLAQNRSSSEETTQMTNSTAEPLVEATGWALNDKGQVVLIASAPTATPDSPELIVAKCYVP
jgi:filamentous hemagglutinin family protein